MAELGEHFDVLGLGPEATPEEIKSACRDLVKVWHPDRFANESPRLQRCAEEQLKRVNLAYRALVHYEGSEAARGKSPESSAGRETSHQRKDDPYAAPESEAAASLGYQDVAFFRRQWFFWLCFIVFCPIAIAILVSGEVYYLKDGEVRAFGMANRVVAGIIGAVWLWRLVW